MSSSSAAAAAAAAAASSRSPVVTHVTSGEHYPISYIGSKNPIHESMTHLLPHLTTSQTCLQYYGFHTTPIAIYTMNFEDGPRVKGQPKMFHANFTHPHDGSNIVIDGKVYTHKAFSNQQAAYQKDRYGMMIVSPTLCYTMHGVVDNEKKRQERIARELRLDGEEKCARKKRRQVFKINDSAVMMRRDGFEADYPTYAFNTNATYTIAFYARSNTDHVVHNGVRYTHCEHDVFVHISASHGGEIMVSQEPLQPVILPPRKRKPVASPLQKKRRHSDISQDESAPAPAPTPAPSEPHHTPTSPISPPSSPDSHMDSQDILPEFPISHVSESSFVSEKRARVEGSYEPYPSFQSSYIPLMYSSAHPIHSGPSLPLPLPLPMSSPLLDLPLLDPIDPLFGHHEDMLPDTIPTLSSMFSLFPSLPSLDIPLEETDLSWL